MIPLKPVTDSKTIENLQEKFKKKMKSLPIKSGMAKVTFRPKSINLNLNYISGEKVWFSFNNYRTDNRYWNAFGVGDPFSHGKGNDIVIEINYSKVEQPNFRIGGLWAQDGNGNFYLLHSGRIGGGRKGISKLFFKQRYFGTIVQVDISDNQSKEYFLIAALNDKKFGHKVAEFVKDVNNIKHAIKTQTPLSRLDNKSYFDEFYGFKSYTVSQQISYLSNHGKIVKALKEILVDKGFDIRKDNQFDLAIYQNNKMQILFEIKSVLTLQNIFEAIGQLHLYSIMNKASPLKILVIPENNIRQLAKDLKKLGISILQFRSTKDTVDFKDLNKILNDSKTKYNNLCQD